MSFETYSLYAQVLHVCRTQAGQAKPRVGHTRPLSSPPCLHATPSQCVSHSTYHSAAPFTLSLPITHLTHQPADRRDTQEASEQQAFHLNTLARHRS